MGENKEYISQIEGQGNVHISEDAIATVAAAAAVEVEGVVGLSNMGNDVAGMAKKNLAKAVRIRATDDALIIDLSLLVAFGANIQVVAKGVQDAVINNVESIIGMTVDAVNVHVSGVAFEK